MKQFIISIITLLLATGCGMQRQQELKQKEEWLNAREQQVTAREKAVQLKEAALNAIEQNKDSAFLKDTTAFYDSTLIGLWNVKMNCTETTCPGSAVGDTKSEQWSIDYTDKKIVAKVLTDGSLVRIYSGIYNGTSLELMVPQVDSSQKAKAVMVVRLQHPAPDKLEGRREITREEGCRIVYAVTMEKGENQTTLKALQ